MGGELAAMVERGEDCLDHIEIQGSGFVADSRGVILTAKHVLKEWHDEREAIAKYGPTGPKSWPRIISQQAVPHEFARGVLGPIDDGSWFNEVYSYYEHPDESVDLAALILGGEKEILGPLSALTLATDEAHVGDQVIAGGFPLGRTLLKDSASGFVGTPSLVSGIVSAVLPGPGTPPELRPAFQFDATIVQGASGGPVCDAITGEVVGLTIETWTTRDGSYSGVTGRPADKYVAFPRAIPITRIREFLVDVVARWDRLLDEHEQFARHMDREMHSFLPAWAPRVIMANPLPQREP